MTIHLYAELNPKLAGINPNAKDRIELVKAQAELKQLALELNVLPLSAFYSYDLEMVEEFLDEAALEQAEKQNLPEWFEPEAGLATVRALQDRLRAAPEGLGFQVERALRELDDLENILVNAQAHRAHFRLYPGF